jgi:hypothetical protein
MNSQNSFTINWEKDKCPNYGGKSKEREKTWRYSAFTVLAYTCQNVEHNTETTMIRAETQLPLN